MALSSKYCCGPPSSASRAATAACDRPRTAGSGGIAVVVVATRRRAAVTPSSAAARTANTTRARPGGHASITTGTIIGRRLVRSLTNLPGRCAARRARAPRRRARRRRATSRRVGDRVARLVEQVLGLGRVHPAAGDDLRAGEHLAGLDVDGDDDHDHALLGEHLAVAEHALADVADDAVDVEVAGRHPAGRCEAVVGRASARRRPRTPARGRAARPSATPSLALATRWRYSPWIGHEPLGLGDRQVGLDLVGLGVAGGVHVGDAGVDRPRRRRAAGRRSPG